MTISINQITTGMALRINEGIYVIVDYDHVKPGKGSAFARIKLKNIKTQQVLERTYKTADKLEDVPLEEKKLQNLYKADSAYHFMDHETFEEVVVSEDMLEDAIPFLQDNLEVTGLCVDGEILKIVLPTFIIAEIAYTEPGFKGDSSKSVTKAAQIDSGATIQVPLFIDIGDKIKVDTRTGEYVERVKQ